MADFWQPSVASYFGRVSQQLTLDAVKETCGSEALVEISGLKKAEMCKRAEVLMAWKRWVPLALRGMEAPGI